MFDSKCMFFVWMVKICSGVHGVLHSGRRMLHEEITLPKSLFRHLLLTVLLGKLVLNALSWLLGTLLIDLPYRKPLPVEAKPPLGGLLELLI
jgi:hypothetical protein